MDVKSSHMAKIVSYVSEPHKMHEMESTVLDSFTKLTSENDIERLNGGVSLLRYLFAQSSNADYNNELKYALVRLVRSLGSSRICSKKGSYTIFTVLLTMCPDLSIDQILSIMDTELKPGKNNPKSENADIYMGRILTCGALIRSKLLVNSAIDIQSRIIQNLIDAGKQRSYLSFASTIFFVEFLNELELASFKAIVWPIAENEFGKPWLEQTLDTFYVLLVIRNKFPELIDSTFCKNRLGCTDIICEETLEDILRVLTDLQRNISSRHPVFKLFSEKLASSELVSEFWTCIDKKFSKPSKNDERAAVEILKQILSNAIHSDVLPSLLSPNFLQYMLKKLSNCRRNNNDDIVVTFKESLSLLGSTASSKDVESETKISILKRLMLYPGDLLIEKKTGIKVIQVIIGGLNFDGIKELSKMFRDIIDNTIPKEQQNSKNETWTNAERSYTAQLLARLMGHPESIRDQEWRLEHLKFLFEHGLCEISTVGTELASQLKESFYRALDIKLPKLNDLRGILSALIHYLDKRLNSNNLKLRTPLSATALETWRKVVQMINNLENNTRNPEALPIFHTMNLHMGLQLFSDPDIAIMSINELQSCYERLIKKSKKRKKINREEEKSEEPEWIEVVVDLLLSLLSRNSHLLRSLVGCVFPHICSYLTSAAVYQILSVLDTKNDKSPLSAYNDTDDDEDTDVDAETNNSSSSEDEDENETEDGISTEESESDIAEEFTDEDETVTDRLRVAVRQALGDASLQTDDEDIDVDQITEEEGKRLDESLSAAFRILRENRKVRLKKQEKSAQALTHFRVRVIDLIEAYLEFGPSMVIVIDMLVPLFVLLEFCIKDPHQKPLEHRVRSCLKRLSTIKKFKTTEGVTNNLVEAVLKVLIEKGERTASVCQEMGDKLAECCTFLVRCVQQVQLSDKMLINIYGENLTAFFKKRDCVLPAILFKSVLQLCWEGNWQLAQLLVDFAFDSSIRSFRRSQAVEFLIIFYKNARLISADANHIQTRIQMEKKLCRNSVDMFKELHIVHTKQNGQSTSDNRKDVGKEVKEKFVCLLLTLLNIIRAQHLPQAWNWEKIAEVLTVYRTHVSLSKDTKSAYNKLTAQIGALQHISRKMVCQPASKVNAEKSGNTINGITTQNGTANNEENSCTQSVKEKKKRKKNRSRQREKQVLRKEARELRLKAMSEGLQTCDFNSIATANGIDTTINGGTHCEELDDKSFSQKRPINEISVGASKRKKNATTH